MCNFQNKGLIQVDFFQVGYCSHPECMVIKGGNLSQVRFPAMAACIEHDAGILLFDTGYASYFFDATRHFPEKFYALTTPVTQDSAPLCQQLGQDKLMRVKDIFLSHFHADHIAGIRDFAHAQFICSRLAYEFSQSNHSRFMKTKQGVLPELLPENFIERAVFIEDLPIINLPKQLFPFTEGRKIYDHIIAIELPGHAIGHYGLWLADANLFLIADAVWDSRTISANRRPNPLTKFIMADAKAFSQTIDKLQILHKNSPHIQLIPSHCRHTLSRFIGGLHE